ncbi:ChaN family lipoprotein [uncultured Tateyamaria sp.]|uniref:ChaN family lipoprotein n=1 Tax=uncultured Tateyamaria sp. TaxID=455651 RepID=UPI002623DAA4|nr:ChaN family lipoprotein [uncultured Tateyamaria sp.]
MRYVVTLILVLMGLPGWADLYNADVIIIGEAHDNPAHHRTQADIVAEVKPAALVFEMLTEAQAARHVAGADLQTLADAFDWEASGWPDFEMYYPIFRAAPQARVFGAGVPRAAARQAMTDGVAAAFGIGAGTYGLTTALDPDAQATREALQMAAHCDALPADMLPAMVDIQRLRDAQLAKMAVRAFDLTGGPVVVITGNGHARTDWGVPVYLARAPVTLSVLSIGQGEDRVPPAGTFDLIKDAPGAVRSDPCAAFQTSD